MGVSYSFPSGSVVLVGAGPGSPDLLTRAGERFLSRAEVIVKDALLEDGFEALFPPGALVIDAGKRRGDHRLTQDETNRLLAEHALAGKRVVRLKGGDPFLFGRGSEEAEYLASRGVVVHVVPGVSSLHGVATSAGIPLTHRGLSDRVLVLHGAHPEHPDWTAGLADFKGTAVVFMGGATLAASAKRFLEAGWSGATPSALVENGTWASASVIRGSLDEAARGALAPLGGGPALWIVGDVSRGVGRLEPSATSTEGSRSPAPLKEDATKGRKFPVWLDLTGKKVLVVGGGTVAEQKIAALLPSRPRIVLVAKKVNERVLRWVDEGRLSSFRLRGVNRFDLWGSHLVISATNDEKVNARVAAWARARRIWVNAVDDPPSCDFFAGALIERGPLRISLSTSGELPGLSGLLRRVLDELLPPSLDGGFEELAALRRTLRGLLPESAARMDAVRDSVRLLESKVFALSPKSTLPPGEPT